MNTYNKIRNLVLKGDLLSGACFSDRAPVAADGNGRDYDEYWLDNKAKRAYQIKSFVNGVRYGDAEWLLLD